MKQNVYKLTECTGVLPLAQNAFCTLTILTPNKTTSLTD